MTTRIRSRRGTAAAWASANPVLAAGELGVETDTKKLKAGDGTTAWNALEYALGGGPGAAQLNDRGDYATAQATSSAFAVADSFVWQGFRYVVHTAHTGTSTPDLTKAIEFGPVADALVETVADGTVLELGHVTADDPALAVTTGTYLGIPADADEVQVPLVVGGAITFLPVNRAALAALGVASGAPSAVTALAATPGAGSLAATWGAATPGDSAVTNYLRRYRKTTDVSWTNATGTSTALSWDLSGLDPVAYVVQVAADSADGAGPWSSVTATPAGVSDVMFDEDYRTFDDGPLDTSGWTFDDPFAIPSVLSGVLRGGGSGGPAQTSRTVAGSHNSTITWLVPASHQFNGAARYSTAGGTAVQLIRIEDSIKMRIANYPAEADILITEPIIAVPSHDYEVKLVMDGPNVSLFIDGQAGPSTTSAPYADSSHDIVGFDLRATGQQILRFTVEANA